MSDLNVSRGLGQQPCGSRDDQAAPATAALAREVERLRAALSGFPCECDSAYSHHRCRACEAKTDAASSLAGGPKPDVSGDAMRWIERAYRVDQHNPDGRHFTRYNMQVAYCAGFESAFGAPASTTPASGNEEVAEPVVQQPRKAQKPASPQDRIDVEGLKAAAARANRQISGYQHHLRECEQIAGNALGYPWFRDDQANFPGATDADGVCIGDHVGDTIVAELATRFTELIAQRAALVESLSLMVEIYGPAPYTPVVAKARALLSTIQAGGAK